MRIILTLIMLVVGMELNAETFDFFDLKQKSKYKVYMKVGERKLVDNSDALTVIDIFADRTYNKPENQGWRLFNDITVYPHVYVIEIEHPDGRLLQADIDGSKLHDQVAIVSGNNTTFFDAGYIDNTKYKALKNIFKKYITNFRSIMYVEGEPIYIHPLAPFGYIKNPVPLSDDDTRKVIQIYNSVWNSSWTDVGSIQRIMSPDWKPFLPYSVVYRNKNLFDGQPPHNQITLDLTPEQVEQLRAIFEAALEGFNGKHDISNNINKGFATYKNGMLNGESLLYDLSGKLVQKYQYLNGERVYVGTYDSKGKLVDEWKNLNSKTQ